VASWQRIGSSSNGSSVMAAAAGRHQRKAAMKLSVKMQNAESFSLVAKSIGGRRKSKAVMKMKLAYV